VVLDDESIANQEKIIVYTMNIPRAALCIVVAIRSTLLKREQELGFSYILPPTLCKLLTS